MSPSIICLGATPQQEIPDSLTIKLKNKTISIMYIIKVAVNTLQRNIRQARQIKNSLSISKDKVICQSLELNVLDLSLELSYLLIDEF